jgi:hypothetical protein
MALVVWLALTSHALAAHSTRTNTPITTVEIIAKTAARLKKKPMSISRRLRAAYVSATDAARSTRLLPMTEAIAPAYDDDDITNPYRMK